MRPMAKGIPPYRAGGAVMDLLLEGQVVGTACKICSVGVQVSEALGTDYLVKVKFLV